MGIFSKLWFWFLMLVFFLTLIMYDFELNKEMQSAYLKGKMHLSDVHFSEMDQGFEYLKVFADEVDMDDSQNNLVASRVRALFFDKQIATKSGELVASSASKNPHEIVFWGDVRVHNTDNERLRVDELRYYISRKEMYTSLPVTMWKDNMIITGKELRANTQTKEASLTRDIVIRIWRTASSTRDASAMAIDLGKAELGDRDSFQTMFSQGIGNFLPEFFILEEFKRIFQPRFLIPEEFKGIFSLFHFPEKPFWNSSISFSGIEKWIVPGNSLLTKPLGRSTLSPFEKIGKKILEDNFLKVEEPNASSQLHDSKPLENADVGKELEKSKVPDNLRDSEALEDSEAIEEPEGPALPEKPKELPKKKDSRNK